VSPIHAMRGSMLVRVSPPVQAAIRYDRAVGESDASDPGHVVRLGIDLSAPDAADTLRLVRYLDEQGARGEDLEEAVRTGTLGSLALELALRSPGDPVAFPEAAARAGLEIAEAAALWRALGLPDPRHSSIALTPAQVETLQVLAETGRSLLGTDTTLQLARVLGGSIALLAEALVDAFRVKVEMPRRFAGEPYSEVVEDYARTASVMFPALAQVVADVLRTHVLAVSRSAWALDAERATVTRELTVGFADLVGYTRSARALSPAELAAAIGRFESHVGDVVSSVGGRLVKLIGDEAMFVVDDPAEGSELALELVRMLRGDRQLPPVRIGLAAGPVVAYHGDYYGDIVNLAARLVKVAEPGEVLVSQSVTDKPSNGIDYEPIELPPLKGYDQGIAAFRLSESGL
jgi:adenylate cyclase